MFHEELDRARTAAAEAQRHANELELQMQQFSADKRQAEARAGKTEEQLAQAAADILATRRKLEVANRSVERTVLLEQQANAANDKAAKLEKRAAKLQDGLDQTQAELEACREALADTSAILVRREEDFVQAQTLLDAFRQRSAADAVIAGT